MRPVWAPTGMPVGPGARAARYGALRVPRPLGASATGRRLVPGRTHPGAPPVAVCQAGPVSHPRLSAAQFEVAVEDALERIPQALLAQLSNVAIFVEDEPPAHEPDLLGVYDGVPLTERDEWGVSMPDRITLFQGPLQRMCHSRADLLDEIAVTVVHEVAHHFGIDDERLYELGWS